MVEVFEENVETHVNLVRLPPDMDHMSRSMIIHNSIEADKHLCSIIETQQADGVH